MGPATKARAISALALLLAGGCAIGEPVIDRVAPLPPPPKPSCLGPSTLCSTQPAESRAIASRALSGPFCVPNDRDSGADDDDALVNCDEPSDVAAWQNVDVLLRTDEPREVVISGVRVFNTRIRLEGPVTLVFRELIQLSNVELVTTSPESAVLFDDVMGLRLTVGDASTPFAGLITARHSRFELLSMAAASLELDSAMIIESSVAVDFLNVGDGSFRDVALELGDALFAPSHLERTEIVGCRTLSFFGGTLTTTVVPRCDSDEPTRIYNVGVYYSILDGLIVGEDGELWGTQLGRYQPSEYVLWGVAVAKGSMFCDHAVSLKSTDSIRCSDCTEAAFGAPDDDACNLLQRDDAGVEVQHNFCKTLDLRDECTGPVPDRVRPNAFYEL